MSGPSLFDRLFAKRIGSPFALVLTGVTKPGQVPPEVPAADVAPDLAAVVARPPDLALSLLDGPPG